MSFVKNIKKKIKLFIINKRIQSVKCVHLMFNDKFNKPYTDFLNRNFNNKNHLVLCKRLFKQYPFPEGNNVKEIKSLKGLKFDSNVKIFCHSLFDPELVDFLFENKNILKEKTYWIIWGGDLYGAPRDDKNDYVRENFKGYITGGDREYLKDKYDIKNFNFCAAPYIFPISKCILDNTKKIKKDYIQIQINNSCDDSTLEMLDVLSKYKDENIKIVTVLSYGKTDFKNAIIEKGNFIFGNKFSYISEFMTPQEYAQHLSQNDILVLNQNRQQAVGNTNASIYLGSKVFIKKNISTYSDYNNSGIKVYDSDSIGTLTFEDFIKNENKDKSCELIKEVFNEEKLTVSWGKIFEEM